MKLMLEIVAIAIIAMFFVGSLTFIAACDALKGEQR
jgi:hypothetical protein